MTRKQQLNKYKKILLASSSTIMEQVDLEKKLLASGEVNFRGDEIDLASEQRNQEFIYLMGERDKRKLDQIQISLEKIESGDFGFCDECGEAISEKRLSAVPCASFCIDCQEKEEVFSKINASNLDQDSTNFKSE
ncbi:MAG: TraR/DksA family transcriptional regulator [SAR324 cluster bacterium]|nr:TraR/DksA family transcriptional regulator [SAR324 cluster bacterium]